MGADKDWALGFLGRNTAISRIKPEVLSRASVQKRNRKAVENILIYIVICVWNSISMANHTLLLL